MCTCICTYLSICAHIHIHVLTHMSTHTHTHIFAFKELSIYKMGPYGCPMIKVPRLYFYFLEDRHSFKTEVLSISKQAENQLLSIWEQTFLSALESKTEEHFNHTSKTPDYLIHEESGHSSDIVILFSDVGYTNSTILSVANQFIINILELWK